MISRLPKWVEYGAFVLAGVAGIVNAIGLLGVEHQAISHLSGTATLFGAGVLNFETSRELHLLGILLSFLLGAAISGYFLSGTRLKLGRHYDSLLFLEGSLLLGAVLLLNSNSVYGHYVASASCGLQNALATTYSGAIVRTTHVTGIFTDLGIMLGARLKGEAFDKRKALLFVLIIVGFVFGGFVGAYLFGRFQFYALLAPAFVCFALGAVYRAYAIRNHG